MCGASAWLQLCMLACRQTNTIGEAGVDLYMLASTGQNLKGAEVPLEDRNGCIVARLHLTVVAAKALLRLNQL